MRFKNIIFDFDGMLVDSRPGIVIAFKKAVKKLTKKETNEKQIVQLIGSPLVQVLEALLGTTDQQIIDRGSALFKKYYSEEGIYHNNIYPEIESLLIWLKKSHSLFIVSNRIETFMDEILKQHDLKKYFIYIKGTDGTDKQSKKTDYVKYLMDKYHLKKEETIIVGDTENDISAGKANSIYSIGITWGYGSESDLIKAGADTICHTSLELQQFIEKILI